MVRDTVAQYIASKNDLNDSGSTLNMTRAETSMYPIANRQTATNESFDSFNTLLHSKDHQNIDFLAYLIRHMQNYTGNIIKSHYGYNLGIFLYILKANTKK